MHAAITRRDGPSPTGPVAAVNAVERARPRRLALRMTLQLLILGLLLVTVLGVGAVDFVSSRQATEDLELQLVRTSTQAVANDVAASFEPSLRALRELKLRAEFERLPLDDRLQLGLLLADRVRYDSPVHRLAWVDQAAGGLVSAYRNDDNRVILVKMDPAVEGGQFLTWVVGPDGTLTPYSVVLPPYDSRLTARYQAAANASDLVWTGPLVSTDGIPIMNASIGVWEPTSDALLGVLGAQVFLDELPGTLRQALRQHPGMEGFLFDRQGELLASAHPATGELLAALDAALPEPISTLPLNTPIPLRFQYAGVDYAGALQGFRVAGGLEWFIGAFLPEASLLQAVYDRQRVALLAAGAFLLIGVGLGALLSARIARPLTLIARDLTQVAQFRLSSAPAPRSFVHEVAIVSDAVDRMKASLRSFGRYVPTDLVREMLAQGQEARLGGQTRTLTIHFSDIENFTHISEPLTPTEVVAYLAEYLDCMSDAIREHEGTIDKFIGDGIMAFWNAPGAVPDHAAQACRAALRAQERLSALRERWEALGRPQFRARIGLHTGEVIVGNFGTAERFAYTAMGDAVNLASRLEGLNKAYGTYILASQAVRDAAGDGFEWRTLDRVAVVGRTEGTLVSELLGESGQVAAEIRHARDLYEQALGAYFARRFEAAAAGFRAAAAAHAADQAASLMALRADRLASLPPAEDWNGVFLQTSK